MHVIVHGGAGAKPERPDPRATALGAAARAGSLAPDPAGAVVTAINAMERDPQFNAGIGGVLQSDGRVRTDAGIMANDRSIGAVAAMPDVADAIRVAEAVRTQTPHVLLVGDGAVRFATAEGISTESGCVTDKQRADWRAANFADATYEGRRELVAARFGDGRDTVGAVATDGRRLVAGTSTAGRTFALRGRVGDVPQAGSGFFATDAGGASTTGAGEDIVRTTLARLAITTLEAGVDPSTAADRAIETFAVETASTAGIIVATPDGDVGVAHNAPSMQTAVAIDGELVDPQ